MRWTSRRRSISLHPGKNGRCTIFIEISRLNVQMYGYVRLPWDSSRTKLVRGHPLAGLLWERQFKEVLLGLGWVKVTNWECLFVHRKQGLFLSVYVAAIKMAGRQQNMAPM